MNPQSTQLVQYLATLAALLTATLVLAILHNDHGAAVALGAFVGIATGGPPSSGVPRPVVTVGALALAIGLSGFVAGCTAAQAAEAVTWGEIAGRLTCEGAHKLCASHPESGACVAISDVCSVIAPGADPATPAP